MSVSTRLMSCLACAAVLGTVSLMPDAPALAGSQPSTRDPGFQRHWQVAANIPGIRIQETADLTIAIKQDGLTIFYFTKPNHFAHPATARRTAVQRRDGSWDMETRVLSFAREGRDGAMKKWMAQFEELDRRMREDIERNYGKPK